MKEIILSFFNKRPTLCKLAFYISLVFPSQYKKQRKHKEPYKKWNNQVSDLIRGGIKVRTDKVVLVMGQTTVPAISLHLIVLKGFEKKGYKPVIILPYFSPSKITYKAYGYKKFISFETYFPKSCNKYLSATIDKINTQDDLLGYSWNGIRTGRFCLSTAMRRLRKGYIDLGDDELKKEVRNLFEISYESAYAIKKIIKKIKPDAALLVDRGYTPEGELFDECISNNIPCYTWNVGHKNNVLLFKRYEQKNKEDHPVTLSNKSWETVKNIEWSDYHDKLLRDELFHCYSTGEWYGEVATQKNKYFIEEEKLYLEIGIDKSKKTAVVFSHIFWDATFFWGEDIFRDYEEWFIETIKCACANPNLNWIIKVHPANYVKNIRDNIAGESSEVLAIKKHIGNLPDHVKLLDEMSNISTWSIFKIMDYCITVRGTVGIESALLGKVVVTAGTGRYDGRGFTIDPKTKNEYFDIVNDLHNMRMPTKRQIELAKKYAFGIYLCRNLHLSTFRIMYEEDEKYTQRITLTETAVEHIFNMQDVCEISEWIDSKNEDFFIFRRDNICVASLV